MTMLAAGCAWTACWLGQLAWGRSFAGFILSPLLLGIVGTGTFYLVETSLEAAMLSRGGVSPWRIRHRNYANAFPEPLTYAVFGYGIYLVSGLLGFWTAMLVFTLPILWLHNVLASRTRTLGTTDDLVRSIANAVELKDGHAGAHTSALSTAAAAVAR